MTFASRTYEAMQPSDDIAQKLTPADATQDLHFGLLKKSQKKCLGSISAMVLHPKELPGSVPDRDQVSTDSCLYTDPVFRKVAGLSLHPGGLELTRSAIALCLNKGLLSPKAVVLDIGCGVGGTLGLLVEHGFNALGIDRDPDLLREALGAGPPDSCVEHKTHSQHKALLGNTLLRGQAQELPLATSSLDGIFCECVLSLLPNPLQGLAEFARVLRPGGCLVLSDIILDGNAFPGTAPGVKCGSLPGGAHSSGQLSGRESPGRSCLQGAVSYKEVMRRLQDAGFKVVQSSEHAQALKQLAVSLIWHGAKPGALSAWLGLPEVDDVPDSAGSLSDRLPGSVCSPKKRFSYAQWIAVKEGV